MMIPLINYFSLSPAYVVSEKVSWKCVVRRIPVLVSSDDEAMETEKDKEEDLIAARIRKLQEEVEEQTQRRLQSSKALDVCASKNEFEGSFERVEFERLLLEAHHKHSAASAEIRRLKTEGLSENLEFCTSSIGSLYLIESI